MNSTAFYFTLGLLLVTYLVTYFIGVFSLILQRESQKQGNHKEDQIGDTIIVLSLVYQVLFGAIISFCIAIKDTSMALIPMIAVGILLLIYIKLMHSNKWFTIPMEDPYA